MEKPVTDGQLFFHFSSEDPFLLNEPPLPPFQPNLSLSDHSHDWFDLHKNLLDHR